MKQLFISVLLALVIGSATASAATTQDENEGKYSLKNGNLTMTIDAAKGAKILSFKYDDGEIISQSSGQKPLAAPSGLVRRKSGSGLLCLSTTRSHIRWKRQTEC